MMKFVTTETAKSCAGRLEKYTFPEPMSGCWLWIGSLDGKNYGHLKIDGRYISAHRLSYVLHKGEYPLGLMLLHRCDNTYCINPDHLIPGTSLDNMRDMVAKGRVNRWLGRRSGDGNPNSRITSDTVRLIRARWRDGLKYAAIAAELGISSGIVGSIVRGERWVSVN